MTGKRYYLTTLAAWKRHSRRCTESHFIALGADHRSLGAAPRSSVADSAPPAEPSVSGNLLGHSGPDAVQILALIAADESAHIALESDPEVEALPHPLARMPISGRAAAALVQFGVVPGDDTFTAAEKLARVHPLLKHRVF